MIGAKFKNQKIKKRLSLMVHSTLIQGVLCAAIGFFLTIALSSFDIYDRSWFYFSSDLRPIHNKAGMIGAQVAAALFYFLGSAAYLLIFFCFLAAYIAIRYRTFSGHQERFLACIGLIVTYAAYLQYQDRLFNPFMQSGGLVGKHVYVFLRSWLDLLCTSIFLYSALFIQFLLVVRLSFLVLAQRCMLATLYVVDHRHIWLYPVINALRYVMRTVYYASVALLQRALSACVFMGLKLWNAKKVEKDEVPVEDFWKEYSAANQVAQHAKLHKDEQGDQVVQQNLLNSVATKGHLLYRVPSVNLFTPSERSARSVVSDEHKQLVKVLEEKLIRFGVSGKVLNVKPGPVITLFEYQPDIDAKVSKILALENDLAMALEAMSVRIIAPIPGTSKVGFEVSNKERKSVRMGDIVRSVAFTQSKAHLPLVLGQDTAGDAVVVDLLDMPHVLIAGSTGSGKSIALNTMLASLLCKLSPDELRLIIVDPKRLEFAQYHDIAHLLFPVITDSRRAAPVVAWLVRIMEERYEMMARQGVRNILDYKKRCKEQQAKDELPFIVLLIDELADLMMVAGKDIEEGLARLAQMARAAGIHLIVATQRPSVDVLTGVIKVNFPSRISFRVTSKIDSRTILDTGGAENLLGKGDMLFMDAQSARLRRIHGAYVSDTEITAMVAAIKAQVQVQYVDIQEVIAAYSSHQSDEESDPLMPQVGEFLQTVDEVSISFLQRRFKIGYNRSARIMEQLESQGKILPSMGGKMRKVIHD